MRRILPILLIVIVISAIIVPYSYSGNASKKFFTVSNEEVQGGDTLEMTIDLNKINYQQFEITLTTDIDENDIIIDNEGIDAQIEEESIKINVNKEEIDFDKIIFKYIVPEDVQADTIYTIIATVTKTENTEEQLASTIIVKVVDNLDENNNQDENKEENEPKENKQNDMTEKENNNFTEMDQKDNIQIKIESKMYENDNNDSKSLTSKISNAVSKTLNSLSSNNNVNSSQEIVTYNGSDNNYLSYLSVEGYTLNKIFNKENATYFVTVNSNITSLNVEALAEDSNAVVCVSGANNIKTGINKILVSVTSESGAVRTYRIYVTKA